MKKQTEQTKKQRPTQIVITDEGFCCVTKEKKYAIKILLAGSSIVYTENVLRENCQSLLADDRRSVMKRVKRAQKHFKNAVIVEE